MLSIKILVTPPLVQLFWYWLLVTRNWS